MQSPLTPQRGRIESNPREYTHMGPRLCGELKTMPADRRSLAVRPPHERGNLDAYRMRVDFRTESASKRPKTVQISTLIFRPSNNPRPCITQASLVSHSSLTREIAEKREIITRDTPAAKRQATMVLSQYRLFHQQKHDLMKQVETSYLLSLTHL